MIEVTREEVAVSWTETRTSRENTAEWKKAVTWLNCIHHRLTRFSRGRTGIYELIQVTANANAYSHFARILGALLNNGVPVLKALSIVEDTVGNVVIAREIHEARKKVTDGVTISGPLEEGKVFPHMLTDMLAIREESGDMPGAFSDHALPNGDETNCSFQATCRKTWSC